MDALISFLRTPLTFKDVFVILDCRGTLVKTRLDKYTWRLSALKHKDGAVTFVDAPDTEVHTFLTKLRKIELQSPHEKTTMAISNEPLAKELDLDRILVQLRRKAALEFSAAIPLSLEQELSMTTAYGSLAKHHVSWASIAIMTPLAFLAAYVQRAQQADRRVMCATLNATGPINTEWTKEGLRRPCFISLGTRETGYELGFFLFSDTWEASQACCCKSCHLCMLFPSTDTNKDKDATKETKETIGATGAIETKIGKETIAAPFAPFVPFVDEPEFTLTVMESLDSNHYDKIADRHTDCHTTAFSMMIRKSLYQDCGRSFYRSCGGGLCIARPPVVKTKDHNAKRLRGANSLNFQKSLHVMNPLKSLPVICEAEWTIQIEPPPPLSPPPPPPFASHRVI